MLGLGLGLGLVAQPPFVRPLSHSRFRMRPPTHDITGARGRGGGRGREGGGRGGGRGRGYGGRGGREGGYGGGGRGRGRDGGRGRGRGRGRGGGGGRGRGGGDGGDFAASIRNLLSSEEEAIRTIYFTRIQPNATDASFEQMCQPYGAVERVVVPRLPNGMTKGHAACVMATAEQAQAAADGIPNARRLRVHTHGSNKDDPPPPAAAAAAVVVAAAAAAPPPTEVRPLSTIPTTTTITTNKTFRGQDVHGLRSATVASKYASLYES